jgi:hypothetical protein
MSLSMVVISTYSTKVAMCNNGSVIPAHPTVDMLPDQAVILSWNGMLDYGPGIMGYT